MSALGVALLCAMRAATAGNAATVLDVVLPPAAIALAPPGLGFALYFGAWHAPRHLALVLDRDERGGSVAARIARFVRESAPNVLASWIAGALVFARISAGERKNLFVAATLALTVPHLLATGYAERRQS